MQLSILSRSQLLLRPVAGRHTKTVPTVTDVHLVKRPVRWTFYAFVFSILFEAAPIGVPLEVTQITGGLLIVAAVFFQPGVCFRRPPAAFWCFIIYFYIGTVILGFYQLIFQGDFVLKQFKIFQLIILFWLAYNVMRDERAARGTLLSLVASCALLSLLHMFGLTTTTEESVSRLDRFAAYGLDSNQLAGALALGVLALVGLVYSLKRNMGRLRFLIWPGIVLIVMAIVQTGSRGGLLALAAGLLVLTLREGTVFTKLRNAFIILLGFGLFFWIAYNSEMAQHRFHKTLDDGSMSGREQIYPMGWQMFLERPVIGWGPVENTIELGNRLQMPRHERMDTHNMFLYVLTATGIIGTIPFLTGVWLCLRGAWRARGGSHGVLPLALTVSLLTANLSVSGFHWKQHWLILAYAVASECQFAITSSRVRSKLGLLSLRPHAAGNTAVPL